MPVVIICLPLFLLAKAVPIRAILLDSVPPEVKTISFSSTFKVLAIIFALSFI